MSETKNLLDETRINEARKAEIVAEYMRYINAGQVKYVRSGHLDVIETQRKGVAFVDPVPNKKMYDCFTSAGCFNVGRHNLEVMRALSEAIKRCDIGSYNMTSETKVALAEKLVSIAPLGLNRVIYAAGGGDAVDCAIKLARGATGRPQVISTIKAYHGHTGFALSGNGKQHYRHYCEPLMPGFSFVKFNDLEAMRAAANERTAAIIIEPVQGEAGIFVGTPEYLKGLRAICNETGAMLIFDEIQTGFCRTGKMFACEHAGVSPDIMTLAKSIGGGLYANAAVLYRGGRRLTEFVEKHPDFHESWCGGSDLGCAVSLAVIEYLIRNKIWENADAMGAKLKGALVELMRENPKIIKDVRGIGLMVGIEYIHEFMGPMMSDALAKNGVFAAYSGNAPQVMRFMVPTTVTEPEMDEIIAAIKNAVKAMKTLLPLALPAAKIPAALRALNNERVQTTLFSAVRKVEDLAGIIIGGKEKR